MLVAPSAVPAKPVGAGNADTVTLADAMMDPEEAVMTADPAPTAVTTPAVDTTATDVGLDAQTTSEVKVCVEALS
jgi:hypothetical protein